jgi:uncharacterized protein YndB with AHSA1/START domain
MTNPSATPSLDLSIEIAAPPGRVLKAFFDPQALRAWWQVTHAVVTPRPLGPFAVEWQPTEFRDEVLGRLGGVFHGTVMQFQAGHGFFVADAYWLPPDGEPVGPMAFEVECTLLSSDAGGRTRLRVRQSGFEESVRWRHYYDVIGHGWEHALAALKALLDK